MEWETIKIKRDTKEILDSLRNTYGSYDNAIKAAFSSFLPYVISLTKTCPPSTWIQPEDNYKEAPFLANVVSCNIYFPPGCEDLVSVRIGIVDKEITDWIVSGDGKNVSIPINKTVKRNERIWAEIMNKDSTYPHTPTIEVILSPLTVRL